MGLLSKLNPLAPFKGKGDSFGDYFGPGGILDGPGFTINAIADIWVRDGLLPESWESLRQDFYNPLEGIKNWLIPSMPAPGPRGQMLRDAASPRRLVYGTCRVGGQLVFVATSGATSQYLHIVMVVADHEVEAITDIYLGEILSTDARYNGKVDIVTHLGSGTDQPFPTLVAENLGWTDAHLLVGCAAVYVKLTFSSDAFPLGVPVVNAVVQGKNDIYDPRTASYGYSNNWALVVADFMTYSRGMAASLSEIDTALLATAADTCDEAVVADSAGSTTEPRYTINGPIDLVGTAMDVLQGLLRHGGGAFYSGGVWKIHPWAAATSVGHLDESSLAGAISFSAGTSKASLINTMSGAYVDPSTDYQLAALPVMTAASYVAADLEELRGEINLPLCTSPTLGQRLQKITMEKARRGLTVSFPAKLEALGFGPMDRVTLSIASLGWDHKEFLVDGIDFSLPGPPALKLVEDDADIYTWEPGEVIAIEQDPLTNLPNPFLVPVPTGLTLASGTDHLLALRDGTIISRILASWNASASAYVTGYEIEYRRAESATWTRATSDEASTHIAPVEDGAWYVVRVRAVNSIGVRSAWVTSSDYQVVGKTETPPDVDTFTVKRQPDGTREYSWTMNNPPVDLAGYKIRYKLGTGYGWGDLAPLHAGLLTASPFESNQLAAGTYTIAIKAVDTTGNESTNAVFIEVTLGDPRIASAIDSADAGALGWPGTLTQCYLEDDGNLYASNQDTWADLTSLTWATWNDWRTNPYLSMTYEHPVIDLGVVATFTPLVSVLGNGTPTIEIATSDDDVTYSSWAASGSLVTCRYIKVRVTMAVSSGNLASLSAMLIILSATAITEDIEDLDTSTLTPEAGGGVRLPLAKSYSVIKSVQLALQSVGAGYSWELIDKSTSGPHVKIYDNTGTLAYPVIDAAIKGI